MNQFIVKKKYVVLGIVFLILAFAFALAAMIGMALSVSLTGIFPTYPEVFLKLILPFAVSTVFLMLSSHYQLKKCHCPSCGYGRQGWAGWVLLFKLSLASRKRKVQICPGCRGIIHIE